jgi:hypothetical protein
MRIRDPGWRQFGSGIRDGNKSDPGYTSRIRNTGFNADPDWLFTSIRIQGAKLIWTKSKKLNFYKKIYTYKGKKAFLKSGQSGLLFFFSFHASGSGSAFLIRIRIHSQITADPGFTTLEKASIFCEKPDISSNFNRWLAH